MQCELQTKMMRCACGKELREPAPGKITICSQCGAEWTKSNTGWSKGEIYQNK